MKKSLFLLPQAALAALLLAGCASTADRPSTTSPSTGDAEAMVASAPPKGSEQPTGVWGGSPVARPVVDDPDPAPESTGWPKRPDPNLNWCALALPTGVASTSSLGLEKGTPREVRANQPFECMIVVTNLADHTISEVVVQDVPSEDHQELRITSAEPMGQRDGLGMIWNLGNMAPNSTKIIRVTCVAPTEGTVANCITGTHNTVLCAQIPVVQPRLKLTKAGPAEVLRCEPIEYRFEVTNTGTGSVQGVTIADELPSGLTSGGNSSINFNVGDLAPGQSRQFTATANASKTGTFTNMATASGSGAGAVTASSNEVRTVVKAPKLTIDKRGNTEQFIDRTARYSITVKNTGNGVARNTRIVDTLPAGSRFIGADNGGTNSGQQVTWSLGDLAPGATKTVNMQLTASTSGTFRNVATAQAFCAEQVTDAVSTVFSGIPGILLEVVDVTDPIEVGSDETYVITVTNQGSAPSTNILVVATMAPEQTYVSSSGATAGTARGKTVTFAALPTLAPKAQATWRVVVKATSAGDARFKVTMDDDWLGDIPVEETEATNQYQVGEGD